MLRLICVNIYTLLQFPKAESAIADALPGPASRKMQQLLRRNDSHPRMSRLAIDELWACLCPSWSTPTLLKAPTRVSRARRIPQCLNAPHARRAYSAQAQFEDRPPSQRRLEAASRHYNAVYNPTDEGPARAYKERLPTWRPGLQRKKMEEPEVDFATESTSSLYSRLKACASRG